MRILITGFGPFGNVVKNPAERLVRRFRRDGIAGAGVQTRVFPVSYADVDRELPVLLGKGSFDVVLLLGVAAGEDKIRIERYGRNRDSSKTGDVEGKHRGRSITRGAKRKLETTVKVGSLKKLLRQNGIGGRISKDAGGFLCNHAYYVALQTLSEAGSPAVCLFVHVPCDRKSLKDCKPDHVMPLRKQYCAVRLIAEYLCQSAKRSKA